jgi:hypothetical protein
MQVGHRSQRPRLNWVYDDAQQEFKTPSGRVISLEEIAQAIYDGSTQRLISVITLTMNRLGYRP